MPLEQQLNDTLRQAIRDKDLRTANVVRMLKTRVTERTTARGFTGQVDDALVTDVIGSYRKQLQKALAEYEKVGVRGAQQAEELKFEIAFCERFLPKGMDEGAVRDLVRERISALAIADAKQIGRVVGDVMKTHKGQVDAADVKRIAEELLTGPAA
ncbi:MAG: GatB/YqeY domain-containing protein [Candidatus Rokubacteria bacterium]|nr:GatB/YqeY domain-containing protein [Candidatus Rokubacteria bacterium]